MSTTASTAFHDRTLGSYWSLFTTSSDAVDALVSEVFTPTARIESGALDAPVVGHADIGGWVLAVRGALGGATARRVTDVQWVGTTGRWCWVASGPTATRRGMDVVRLTPDASRIGHLVVFDGLLPPSATAGTPDDGRGRGGGVVGGQRAVGNLPRRL